MSSPSSDTFRVDVATDMFGVPFGTDVTLTVHHRDKCQGDVCAVHNPTMHHMRSWPTTWRADRSILERRCPDHGVGHPDPDDLAHNLRIGNDAAAVHGCCGCCHV